MDIKQSEQNGIGEFTLNDSGSQAGRLVYSMEAPSTMVIKHTEVNKEHEGKGLAKKLVVEAVSFARQSGLRVVAKCSYAARVIQRDPSLQDVL